MKRWGLGLVLAMAGSCGGEPPPPAQQQTPAAAAQGVALGQPDEVISDAEMQARIQQRLKVSRARLLASPAAMREVFAHEGGAR